MKRPPSVFLRFHTVEGEPGRRRCVAEAIDAATGDLVAAMSLEMMAAWLEKHHYRWRFGSSGIWERRAA